MKPFPSLPQLLEIDTVRRFPDYAPHDDGSILSLLLGKSRDKSTWFQQALEAQSNNVVSSAKPKCRCPILKSGLEATDWAGYR